MNCCRHVSKSKSASYSNCRSPPGFHVQTIGIEITHETNITLHRLQQLPTAESFAIVEVQTGYWHSLEIMDGSHF